MPTTQGRNELRPLAADDPGELKPAIGDGPTAPLPWEIKSILPGEGTAAANLSGDGESRIPDAGFCRANPPWTGRHVLGGVTVSELTLNGDLHLAPRDQQKIASSIKQQTYFGDPDGVATGIWKDLGPCGKTMGFLRRGLTVIPRYSLTIRSTGGSGSPFMSMKALSTGCGKLPSEAIGQS
jgi:hypothetical protein